MTSSPKCFYLILLLLSIQSYLPDKVIAASIKESSQSVTNEAEPGFGSSRVFSHRVHSMSGMKCGLCHWGSSLLLDIVRRDGIESEFLSFASSLCSFLASHKVCKGTISSMGKELFKVLKKGKKIVKSNDICAMITEESCEKTDSRLNNWKLDLPDLDKNSDKNDFESININYPTKKSVGNRDTEVILHLSDPHVQLDYIVGAAAECNEPLCCSSPPLSPSSRLAAYFGDYSCDLPPWSLDKMLAKIREKHAKIDYIILTGDFPAHDIWQQDSKSNFKAIQTVVKVIRKHFYSTKVFPAVGNHDSFPVNSFPENKNNSTSTDDNNASKLYDGLAELFKPWLSDAESQSDLRKGGYYSIKVRNGLRIISLNSNVCNNFNFWLLLDFSDPWHHLKWLYYQLKRAEDNNEKVILLGHIPPGSKSCLRQWAHEYRRVMIRFQSVIVSQFYGHTHFDEFEITFDNEHAVNVAYLAPSLTPLDGVNPAYRLYTLDGDHEGTTNLVLDHSTFVFDLEMSNGENSLVHQKEYEAIADLGLKDLSPDSWTHFVFALARNQSLFEHFRRFYYRDGPAARKVCEKECKNEMLCALMTSSRRDANCNFSQHFGKAAKMREQEKRFDEFWGSWP